MESSTIAGPGNATPGGNRAERGASRRTPLVCWLAVLALILSTIIVRQIASGFDFAMANILTVLLSFLTWAVAVVAMRLTSVSRFYDRLLLWGPIVGGAIALGLFKFERLDGELRPKFSPRWSSSAALPSQLESAQPSVDSSLLAPLDSDFPGFLGRDRDATIRGIDLAEDWTSHPPKIRWKQTIGDGWSGFAVQGALAITMEQRGEQEWVSAYNIEDGSLLWKHVIQALHTSVLGGTGPRSTPTIANNRVYACSAVSKIVCLDIFTGQPLWSQSLLELAGTSQAEFEAGVAWGRSTSPLVLDELVIVPLGGASRDAHALIAFDAATGEERWRGGQDQISYASPSVAELCGVQQVLCITESQLAAYQPESGEVLWSTPWPGNSNSDATASQPVVLDRTHVFLSKGYGEGARMLEIELTDGKWAVETLWQNSTVLRTKFTNCVFYNGYLYGLSDGILECVDATTGKRKWKRGRYRQGQLLRVGEHLLISAETGELALVKATPEGFTELARLPLIGDVTWNTLTLSGARALVRNSDEVACVLLPLVETKDDLETSAGDFQDAATPESEGAL